MQFRKENITTQATAEVTEVNVITKRAQKKRAEDGSLGSFTSWHLPNVNIYIAYQSQLTVLMGCHCPKLHQWLKNLED